MQNHQLTTPDQEPVRFTVHTISASWPRAHVPCMLACRSHSKSLTYTLRPQNNSTGQIIPLLTFTDQETQWTEKFENLSTHPPTNQLKQNKKNTCPGLVTSSGRTGYVGSWTVRSYIAKERKVCSVREFGLARRCWTFLRIPNLPTATFSRGKAEVWIRQEKDSGMLEVKAKAPKNK